MKKPLVSIIIVNWNGRNIIGDCLRSLERNTYKNYEAIVVDNASTDDSVDYILKNFRFVKLIQNKTNVGVSEGHDIGFKNTIGTLILLLNSDTIIEKNVIAMLVDELSSRSEERR